MLPQLTLLNAEHLLSLRPLFDEVLVAHRRLIKSVVAGMKWFDEKIARRDVATLHFLRAVGCARRADVAAARFHFTF